jgi:hypothetical protein
MITESEGETMNKRIKLTNQVIKTIEQCVPDADNEVCLTCPLYGACLEYFTGDDSCNQDVS